MNDDKLQALLEEKHCFEESFTDLERAAINNVIKAVIREAIQLARQDERKKVLEEKWNLVSEGLPEPGVKFVAYDEFMDFFTGTFTTSEQDALESLNFYTATQFKRCNITHWMEIREPAVSDGKDT
jgi:hypothetical protein